VQIARNCGLTSATGGCPSRGHRTHSSWKVASQEAATASAGAPDRELAFLHPCRSAGCGASAPRPREVAHHGIYTVADVAELSEAMLDSMVGGGMGHQLFACRTTSTGAGGDGRAAPLGRGAAGARRRNTMSDSEIDAVVINLVDASPRMRKSGAPGGRVLRLRFDDFSR